MIEELKEVVDGKKDILEISLSDRADMRALGWVGRDINGNSYVTKRGKLAVKEFLAGKFLARGQKEER